MAGEPEGFDIEGFARRLSAGQGEITFIAPLPPQLPGELAYPQHVCAVGLGTRTLTVTVAVPPPGEEHEWLSGQAAHAERRHGRRSDLGNGMTQWEFGVDDEEGSLYERGLAYRAGRYVVELRLHSHEPVAEADGDMLRVAALSTIAPLMQEEWGR